MSDHEKRDQCQSAPNIIRECLRPEFEPGRQRYTMQHSQINVHYIGRLLKVPFVLVST